MFTGVAEDITKYAAVTVSVFSDKVSVTNGLSIQFSPDGTNWDNTNNHTVSASTPHVTTDAVQAKYFRVIYTNGTTAQTSFRLQVIYATKSVGPIVEELGGDASDQTSSLTTKAILHAKNPAGVYGAIGRTTGGNLKVSIEEQDGSAGLATSAKQDTLLTELQLKADLTETQPVSIDQATPGTTNLVQNKEMPDATSTFNPTNATSTAYEASRVVKASAGTLYSVTGYNSKTSAQFIMVFNATSLPANGTAATVMFTVPASSNFSYSADKFGRFFSIGITVANSSTGPTITVGSADCFFDCQYQ